MKKRFLLTCVLALGMLASCGEKPTSQTSQETSEPPVSEVSSQEASQEQSQEASQEVSQEEQSQETSQETSSEEHQQEETIAITLTIDRAIEEGRTVFVHAWGGSEAAETVLAQADGTTIRATIRADRTGLVLGVLKEGETELSGTWDNVAYQSNDLVPSATVEVVWKNRPAEGAQERVVPFKLTYAGLKEGEELHVLGDFNGWTASEATKMTASGEGVYELSITMLEGDHEFKFVIKGAALDWNTLNASNRKVTVVEGTKVEETIGSQEEPPVETTVSYQIGEAAAVVVSREMYNETAGEYQVLGIELSEGAAVVFKSGETVLPIENEGFEEGFVAPRAGSYDFYIKTDKVWITIPAEGGEETPTTAKLTVTLDRAIEEGRVILIRAWGGAKEASDYVAVIDAEDPLKLTAEIDADRTGFLVAVLKEGEAEYGADWINVAYQSNDLVVSKDAVEVEWKNRPAAEAKAVAVSFKLTYSELKEGEEIHVLGDFNGWTAAPENKMSGAEGVYELSVEMLEGNHEFKFVIVKAEADADWVTLNPGYEGMNNRPLVAAEGAKVEVEIKSQEEPPVETTVSYQIGEAAAVVVSREMYNETAGEYQVLGIELSEGAAVVFKSGETVLPIENEGFEEGFVAPRAGSYDFYIKADKVWITIPKEEAQTPVYKIVGLAEGETDEEKWAYAAGIGGEEAKDEAYKFQLKWELDLEAEVVFKISDGADAWYGAEKLEEGSAGAAESESSTNIKLAAGKYTVYFKIYNDDHIGIYIAPTQSGEGGQSGEETPEKATLTITLDRAIEEGRTIKVHAWNDKDGKDYEAAVDAEDSLKLTAEIDADMTDFLVAVLKDGETEYGEDWSNVVYQSKDLKVAKDAVEVEWLNRPAAEEPPAADPAYKLVGLGGEWGYDKGAEGEEVKDDNLKFQLKWELDLEEADAFKIWDGADIWYGSEKLEEGSLGAAASESSTNIALAAGKYTVYFKIYNDDHIGIYIAVPQAEAQEIEIAFTKDKMQASVSSYTSDWEHGDEEQRLQIINFNNNKKDWDFIKAGSKSAASVAKINTKFAVKSLSEVDFSLTSITASNVNSVKILVSSNADFSDAKEYTVATADLKVGVVSTKVDAAENVYVSIVFDLKKGSGNGFVVIDKVIYK